MIKIVLTGGPCSGKTTGLNRIEESLTKKGYKVIIVPEIATELMKAGLNRNEVGLMKFQETILNFQAKKDMMYEEMAGMYEDCGMNTVVIYDRGTLDSKAYMSTEDWNELLSITDFNESHLLNAYDGVFHLKTIAYLDNGYTVENNETRSESKDEAVAVDKRTIDAWTGHRHLRIIDNCQEFDEKIDNLLNSIYSLLGIPIPIEIEKKFLIEMPDIDILQRKYKSTVTNILQTYLTRTNDTERRVRQSGLGNHYSFYYTEKRKINETSRYEVERKITKNEYFDLLMQADTNLKQIRKDRHCFVSNNTYYELDIYPFWDNQAIMEIELTNESEEVYIPEYIHVIKDVTNDINFKNYSLANR